VEPLQPIPHPSEKRYKINNPVDSPENEPTVTLLLILCMFAFLAGLVDAVVGGGGLIQLPALLILYPQVPIATLFGTNKLSSIAGTSVAVVQYGRYVSLTKRVVLPGAIAAGCGSFAGARCVQFLNPQLLRPVILVLLVLVCGYTYHQKNLGSLHKPVLSPLHQAIAATLIGLGLGFYDGFFGPGTGSFILLTFISILGFDFLHASASAKVLNWATNFTAIIAFASNGHLRYSLAFPMAAFNIVGALVGTRLAILKGNRFVRQLFLFIVLALIAKLTYDLLVSSFKPGT
jgi:uncharacterized protein